MMDGYKNDKNGIEYDLNEIKNTINLLIIAVSFLCISCRSMNK